MSQKDDSENDIWEYKPLEKKRRKPASASAVAKRRCTSRSRSSRVKPPEGTLKGAESADASSHAPSSIEANHTAAPRSGDFCPVCQMPFSVLVVQSQRWHVSECLDSPRDECQECPDGLRCSSTNPSHYKSFNHTLLAHRRANSDAASVGACDQAETSLSQLARPMDNENHHKGSPASKPTNGLLFLRSPGPEDFKKRKGWSSSSRGQRSVSSSQESKPEPSSTLVKAESGENLSDGFSKSKPSSNYDDEISYSPLSAFPVEKEVKNGECRKALFNDDENEDSMVLFSDAFSSEDELFTGFIDNLESHSVPPKDQCSSNTQVESFTSLPLTRQLPADSTNNKEAFDRSTSATSIQSPQSVVLERLRENIVNKNLNDSIQPEPGNSNSHQVSSSEVMPSQKSQNKPAGPSSCLKQMDIGVFFGLKPLKEKDKETSTPDPSLDEHTGHRPKVRDRQKKSKADATADTSGGTATVNTSNMVTSHGESRRGGTRGWRRWRNRGNADEGAELPRCPFYKKIPGTKFVIDAFGYGLIEGVACYFLTHFHSDHYGGLTKNSTFPIYCNRITGNLVKSKLKVPDQYVHILPMNTQVTVEGVRVILLDANHCPGAAMLLFFLPDGQTVLHTGDFRADPSMETYPELLSCRVQTLYLDTTYCSPEYTFPRQQEVINFAANTAFELVTLNPRTLVVCGSYSVGKEKVFLALADVLGSKVCLSRDKYNTMCCLESDQVRQHITTDWKAAQVHVLPMMQLTFKKLQDHLARFSAQYDQLVAFKPTGWTFSQQVESVEDIQPEIRGVVSIYGIPYSEHSSFLELKRFVQWLQPLKIIPTVNNGSWASRKAMEKCFSEWLKETKTKL
ncbi:DNA cross-link repair 1A protein isoform X2 [Betta splendens]|uniref:DNA cross-link repair 1A protein n=1 Tax=Betta splendens TaxID=158456 RepID=A0A6P7LA99_BETSP|nr:DNA cross-link repair 1A protein isoform X2 [Betta splendens]